MLATLRGGIGYLQDSYLWRKNAFCASPDGCRFVEGLLTVVQSLRL
jgi:hypothetical protein